ncbi:hypothetical protein [Streptomyces griseofuscus]|uniref:Uncharacterized protein n=1 Tax=Streptomyces griseofuscus TaxID=146922 RepID=A0A3R8S856_9ACTN|nr:hypothetical protein [Streptomyces griseofuscus]RRQ81514.1 hypothetical protein CQW44_30400 [Streptomyces griseofuscus]
MQLQFPEPVHGAISVAAGEAAKTDGMARAEAHTPVDWATACQNGIREMARRGVPFQAADLIAEGLVDEPERPAMWGPQFGIAARAGVIEHAGVVPSTRATVHRSLCRQWIGAAGQRKVVA